jgi:thioredoxin
VPSCEKIRGLAGRFSKKPPPAAAHPGSLVSQIPDGGYDTFRLQTGRIVIIDFYADWCGPCRQLAPILDRIATEQQGRVVVGKVNVDNFRELASREGVNGIPDVRIFIDGKQVDKFVGLPPETEVRRRIESHAKGLALPTSEAAPQPAKPVTSPMDKDWLPNGMRRR